LEKALVCESKILFEHPPQNVLFARLLQGKPCCTSELKTPSEVVGPKPLLKKLLLQMDNNVKDNKNRNLLTFLSLLIAREVFEEVKLGLLVVGHTHEDIDGCFGYFSKKLRE
jgi:CO dehydrogenase nickel-insertion accessory protein CooC1